MTVADKHRVESGRSVMDGQGERGELVEQDVQVPAPDGTADAVLFAPAGESRWPGVIMLTDIIGIREAHRQVARRLAAEGYVVLMPNIYYRVAKPPLFSFKVDFTEPRTQARAAELRAAVPPDAIERDAATYVDFLSKQEHVASGPLAIVGYCATGSVALRIAAAQPDAFAAVASFHGGGLATDAPTSPHLLLPRIKSRLYFGHATNDRSMPTESIERLRSALETWGGRYDSELYPAAHGWTVPDSHAYNESQADRAFAKLTDLLATALGQRESRRHA
jgi:carboxymethylenebutenolidase